MKLVRIFAGRCSQLQNSVCQLVNFFAIQFCSQKVFTTFFQKTFQLHCNVYFCKISSIRFIPYMVRVNPYCTFFNYYLWPYTFEHLLCCVHYIFYSTILQLYMECDTWFITLNILYRHQRACS